MLRSRLETVPESLNSNARSFSTLQGIIGRDVGVVYLLALSPKYVRFKVVAQDNQPVYQPVSERPLTDEERAHFEALAQIQQ